MGVCPFGDRPALQVFSSLISSSAVLSHDSRGIHVA